MIKNTVVHIIDSHVTDGEKTACELTTSGTLDFTAPDDFTVTYRETDDELEGCETTLKLEEMRRVVMTRTGKYSAEMIIEKERRHTCFYATPFGELMMGIYASCVEAEMTENGGRLKFVYTIDFNNDLASENELTVIVKTKQEE